MWRWCNPIDNPYFGMTMTDTGLTADVAPEVRQDKTVGQSLDESIKNARANVERLCILKAKAEALNILGMPSNFISAIGNNCW